MGTRAGFIRGSICGECASARRASSNRFVTDEYIVWQHPRLVGGVSSEAEQVGLSYNATEVRESILHRIDYGNEFTALRLEHTFGDTVIEEEQEFVIEAINVK
jgi:hypothetical protein